MAIIIPFHTWNFLRLPIGKKVVNIDTFSYLCINKYNYNMKRLTLIITLVASMMMLGGCTEETIITYLPDSHWILHVDGMTEGHRLALTFEGDEMQVDDGTYKTPPFTSSDETWYYYISDNTYLHMWTYYTDSDGVEYTDSYDLKITTNEEMNSMTLVYDPWIGSTRTYTFDRR